MKKTKKIIWWRNFQGTPAYRDMQRVLARHGLHLKVTYDLNKVPKTATDVHVFRVTGS